jgi:hypothetical protein
MGGEGGFGRRGPGVSGGWTGVALGSPAAGLRSSSLVAPLPLARPRSRLWRSAPFFHEHCVHRALLSLLTDLRQTGNRG